MKLLEDRDLQWSHKDIEMALTGRESWFRPQWGELLPLAEKMADTLIRLVSQQLLIGCGVPSGYGFKDVQVLAEPESIKKDGRFTLLYRQVMAYQKARDQAVLKACYEHELRLAPCEMCRGIFPLQIMWVAASFDRTNNHKEVGIYCHRCKKQVCSRGCRSRMLPCGEPARPAKPTLAYEGADTFAELISRSFPGVLGENPETKLITIELPKRVSEKTLESWELCLYPEVDFRDRTDRLPYSDDRYPGLQLHFGRDSLSFRER